MKSCLKRAGGRALALRSVLGLWFLTACQPSHAQTFGIRAQIPAAEYSALVDFFNSSARSRWANDSGWLNPRAASWYGVTVAGGHVTGLSLSGNGLRGGLSKNISDLSHLQTLDLSNNQYLGGGIPESMGNLAQLQNLSLSWDSLIGSIPESLGNLSQLQNLALTDNFLSGNIPASLGNLSQLRKLELGSRYLGYNQLSGSIPSSFGNLTNLENLFLDYNQLSGSIPSSLGNLSNLYYLYLDNNQLSGSIPSSLGNLTNLANLVLEHNQLSGSIPSSLGHLTSLNYLYLDDNQLSGSIPPSLGSLSRLRGLVLNNNQFNGSIPSSLANFFELGYLYLNNNLLSGNIPSGLGNLSKLQYLDFHNNRLSGGIPPSLGNLAQLRNLNLSANQLSGGMPEFPASLSNFINVASNDLNIATGSQSLANIIEMIADGVPVTYAPQGTLQFPSVIWTNPASIPYGTAVSADQLNATANFPGALAYSPASGTILPPGTNLLSVLFTPADTNTYTTASAQVSLVVTFAPLLRAALDNGNRLRLGSAGIPGQIYILQTATSLRAPVNWQPVSTNVADGSGHWGFTNSSMTAQSSGFYRLTLL